MSHIALGIEFPFAHNLVSFENEQLSCYWRLDVLPHRNKPDENVLLVSARLQTGAYKYIGRAIIKDNAVRLDGIRIAKFWGGHGIDLTNRMLRAFATRKHEVFQTTEGQAPEYKQAPKRQDRQPSLDGWLSSLSSEYLMRVYSSAEDELVKRGLIEEEAITS